MFESQYQSLSNAEKRQFTDYVNDLLFQSFIVRKKYDRTVGLSKIQPVYLFIEKHFDLFEDYVNYAGFELVKDDDSGVIYIYSTNEKNRLKLDSVTTLLVYALRYYYEDYLRSNSSQSEVLMDSVSLKILLKDLGLSRTNKRISAISIASSLRLLTTHNIIARAQHSYSDPSYSFYILPSILLVIDSLHMNALYNSINGVDEDEEIYGAAEQTQNSALQDSDDLEPSEDE